MSKDGYLINIHAHSIFSDGVNSPCKMALEAKRLGFTALVITDHFYGADVPEFMSTNSMRLLKKACAECKEIIPIIIGLEVPVLGQEILVFGGAAIKQIMEHGHPRKMNEADLIKIKKETGCAMVLCHPGQDFTRAASVVDAYERFNSGQDFFRNGRSLENLEGLQSWCNSDAHWTKCMGKAFNKVVTKIENETDLIRYIKSDKQPEHVIPAEDPDLRIRSCTK